MADGVFNVAKGKVNEYHDRVDGNDPAGSELVIVLLKVVEADGTLEDYDTLAAILAGSNTEADFTNYARIDLTDADISASQVDDTNNWRYATFGDQTWSSAGGTTDNTLVKLLVCYDSTGSAADSAIVPMTYHDFSVTTNGGDVSADVGANGYFRAT